MKKFSLFTLTILLTIAFCAIADETKGERLASISQQQLSSQTDSKVGNGAFSCSPYPQCERDTNSTWLDLLIQQLSVQSQDKNNKTQNN